MTITADSAADSAPDSAPGAAPGADATVSDFEARARAWLEANVAKLGERPRVRGDDLVAYERELQAKIYDAGFGALTQPKEYGGQGLGEAERQAWERVSAGYAVPRMTYSVSHGMCGPIINLLGTHEQKAKYLPRLWRGDDLWCQLFSEPGAGSDVAGLRTKAEKVEGGWRITGQKVWTTNAQYCERGVIIARTNPDVPKHQGITMFLIDMKAEGVEVRPLRVATGEQPFNEIFFDNVFVPDDDRLSEVDKGWDAAVAMLRFERISIGTGSTRAEGPYAYKNVLKAAQKLGRTDDPAVRAALAELYVLDQGTSLLALRMREEAASGIALNARGSIAKLAGAVANRRTAELVSEILGTALVSWSGFTPVGDGLYPPITAAFAGSASSWTAGGTMEIQRGIIAERVLGLEKDPQVDRGVPFKDIRKGA